jgi:hypothetical protein
MATDAPDIPQGPSVIDNPVEWMADKLQKASTADEPVSEPAAPAQPPEPIEATAEPGPAETPEAPQPQTTWKDLRFPEDDPEVHGFFRGKPLPEVLRSYGYAERKIQEQGHELSTLRTELAAYKALKDMMAPQRPQTQPKTLKDRYADLGVDLDTESITNPERVETARMEILRQEAAVQAEAKLAEERQKSEVQSNERQFQAAVISAAETARLRLDVPRDEYGRKIVGVMATIRASHGDAALLNDQAYEDYYVSLYGKPKTASQEATAPTPPPPGIPSAPNPPGVKRSGSVAPADKVPTLGAEQRRQIENFADTMQFKGELREQYIQKSAAALAALEKR